MLRRFIAPIALTTTALLAAACTQGPPAAEEETRGDLSIAFLMPCSTCADRFESKDKPFFTEAVKQADPSIRVIANNAQGDAAVQLQQAEAALTNGAKVIVVSPFTAEAGASIVAKADAVGAKVIAYDGAIEGAVPAAYVSFQNEKVGELQGQYLLDHLSQGATVAMINGDITSAPGREFKAGAHKVLDPAFGSGRLKLGYESDTPGFDPAKGQAAMEQGLTKLNDKVQGVIAPNDGLANAVITALTSRKLNGKVLVTGQDATDAGLASILVGDQSMTVYKSIRDEASAAAKIAVALAKGDTAGAAALTTTTVDNGTGKVPALLLEPKAIDKDNIADVVKDGYTTKDKICVGEAAAKCTL
ncbi:sugar ABC transporter substrate-binding protein [Actinoplanes sp. TBRC 11911]|uniref:sugar ABC transporter substrate-binding protein n=1 Tax=Actinoplanes sp. TBRC 11911 TaxID=2729386 RepID=UPI00145F2DB7|nr:substrate-binding domain-containing protein [Actinoplanes sp. TBRC 11911]NMO53936.1 sugar ABC transporter substrate-binding protein [Actinoplanes sp. TBRC 11911]